MQQQYRPEDEIFGPVLSGNSPPDPPAPEPEPAPPIIILPESGNARATPAPGYQVQDPAGVQPQPPTSPAQERLTTSRYDLRERHNGKVVEKPNKPRPRPLPEPHPAPPVIILSTKRVASASPPISTSPGTAPTTPSTTTSPTSPQGSTLLASPTSHRMMGSKASKLSKVAPAHGKLQPSQERQDKAEMAEPSDYYSRRSKSMRKKAGKGGAATVAAGGSGGGL